MIRFQSTRAEPACRDYSWQYQFDDTMLATFKEPMGELFVMEQMSLKKGLKRFGKDGANAVIVEMKQLDC
jgi:hypothetical protein